MKIEMNKLLFFHENFVLGGDTIYLETILSGIPPDEFLLIYAGSRSVTEHIQNSGLSPSSLRKFDSFGFNVVVDIVRNHKLIPDRVKPNLNRGIKIFIPLFNFILSIKIKLFLKGLKVSDFKRVIVNSGGFYGTEAVRLFLKIIDTKCTYIVHNHIPMCLIKNSKKFNSVNKNVNEWIVGSEFIKNQLVNQCGVESNRVHLIYYGVKPAIDMRNIDRSKVREKLKIPQGAYVLLHPSVFEKRKGHYFTLKAFRDIKQKINCARLILAGSDGCDKRYVEGLIDKLEIKDSVKFMGFYSPIEELILASDILCLPTQEFDTTPQVILYALACGVPVLTTKREEFEGVLLDEFNALLVPIGDHKTITKKLLKLYKNESLIKRLIVNGLRTYNEHYTKEKMVEATLNFLKK